MGHGRRFARHGDRRRVGKGNWFAERCRLGRRWRGVERGRERAHRALFGRAGFIGVAGVCSLGPFLTHGAIGAAATAATTAAAATATLLASFAFGLGLSLGRQSQAFDRFNRLDRRSLWRSVGSGLGARDRVLGQRGGMRSEFGRCLARRRAAQGVLRAALAATTPAAIASVARGGLVTRRLGLAAGFSTGLARGIGAVFAALAARFVTAARFALPTAFAGPLAVALGSAFAPTIATAVAAASAATAVRTAITARAALRARAACVAARRSGRSRLDGRYWRAAEELDDARP